MSDIRWPMWQAVPHVELWQAVLLSLGIEPTVELEGLATRDWESGSDIRGFRRARGYSALKEPPPEYKERLFACKRGLGVDGPIRVQAPLDTGKSPDLHCCVLLREVTAFLALAGFALPGEMQALLAPVEDALPLVEAPEQAVETLLRSPLPKRGPVERAELLTKFRQLGGKRPHESGMKGKRGALAKLAREVMIDDKNLGEILDKAIEEERRADAFAALLTR